MPTCWCRAGKTRCSPWHAARFPARGHPRDPHFRSGKWRRRAGSALPRASLPALKNPATSARFPVLAIIGLLKQRPETVGYAFLDHIVEIGLECLAELDLRVPPQTPAALAGMK